MTDGPREPRRIPLPCQQDAAARRVCLTMLDGSRDRGEPETPRPRRGVQVGEDGGIDEKALLAWSGEARELLGAADRLDVGEGQIGAILAYAPSDTDGTWPVEAVRNVLEALDSRAVERGMRTAKYDSSSAPP